MWGVPIASYANERIESFCQHISAYDIILLQEVWKASHEATVRNAVERMVPSWYCQTFRGGVVGMGLMILSRYPLCNATVVPYSVMGRSYAVHHGDYFSGKGVAICDVIVGEGIVVKVFTTHTHACYEKVMGRLTHPEQEAYAAVRTAQMLQLAQTVVRCTRPGEAVIVAGDFNCTPLMAPYQIFAEMTGLEASCTGVTYTTENAFNAMATGYYKILSMEEDLPAQLDHLLFSGALHCVHSSVAFTSNEAVALPAGSKMRACPMSDHYGIEAVFDTSVQAPNLSMKRKKNSPILSPSVVSECLRIVRYGLRRDRTLYFRQLVGSGLSMVLAMWTGWIAIWGSLAVLLFLVALTLRSEIRGLEQSEDVLRNM